MPSSSSSTSYLFLLLLLFTATTTASSEQPPNTTTAIGVTYTQFETNPPPTIVATSLSSLHLPTVRLLDPTPSQIRSFSATNISLLLSLPNRHVTPFSTNLSAPTLWLSLHVIPFYPRAKIHVISLGDDAINSSPFSPPSLSLLPALRNLHLALHNFGISTISISTTFSFPEIMTASFPPSSSEFRDPIGTLIINPLLTFLEETNSCFLINIYPYNVYKSNPDIPIGYALFEEHEFNFRDDATTGLRYRSLYDMMIDSVISAMARMGYENVPIVVAETGWPSSGIARAGEAESAGFAEMYLRGLVKHLRSGEGTPMRRGGAAEVYLYQLFDGVPADRTDDNFGLGDNVQQYELQVQHWVAWSWGQNWRERSLGSDDDDDHFGLSFLELRLICEVRQFSFKISFIFLV